MALPVRRFLAGLLLPACLIGTANAGDYQNEIGVLYGARDDSEADFWRASASRYLSPVRVGNHPLAEAAFLEKASRISISYGETDYGLGKTDFTGLASLFYVDNWLFGVGASHSDDFRPRTAWSATAGAVIAPGAQLSLTYWNAHEDGWTVDGKWVRSLSGDTALNLVGNISLFDNYVSYGAGADYYFDRTLSVGAGVSYIDPDFGGSDAAFTARAQKFITPFVSVGASYVWNDDADEWTISAAIRF